MPAPTPIVFRYGRVDRLGGLASAAGAAQYGLSERHRNEDIARETYYRTLAADTALLNSELNRRGEDQYRRNDFFERQGIRARDDARNQRDFDLKSAYQERLLNLRERDQNLDYQAVQDRIAAQRTGNISSRSGQNRTALDLVPAADDIQPRAGGTSRITNNTTGDTYIRTSDGRIAGVSGETMPTRFTQMAAPDQSAMIPRTVKDKLDYIDALNVPEDAKNSLRILARSGDVKLDQLADDAARYQHTSQAIPLDQRRLESMKFDANQIDALLSSNNAEATAAYARQKLRLDPLLTTDADAIKALSAHRTALGIGMSAIPTTNSGGQSPTGGNPISVQTREDVDKIPSGTYYKLPDGTILLKR